MVNDFNTLRESLELLLTQSKQQTEKAFNSTIQVFNRSFIIIILVLVISPFIFMVIPFAIARLLNKSIDQM